MYYSRERSACDNRDHGSARPQNEWQCGFYTVELR